MDLNELSSFILSLFFDVKIEDFELFRTEIPIPGYAPGIFPSDFVPLKTLEELIAYAPTVLFANFVITVTEMSRIRARGVGELHIHRKDKEIEVVARNVWTIEEVQEIGPPRRRIKRRIERLENFVKEVIIKFLASLLSRLATKVILRE